MTISRLAIAAVIAAAAAVVSVPGAFAQSAPQTEAGLVAYGGQLYDWWYNITSGDIPRGTHPSMPADSGRKGKKTWRCIECHGYDFNGAHGVTGVMGSAGKDPAAVEAILRDDKHAYTDDFFTADDFKALAIFVSKGVSDMSGYLKDGKATGDAANGQAIWETVCSVCHGADGKKITDMPPVGAVVNKVPMRSLFRIRYGKPGANMPAMSIFPMEVSVDVLTYAMTLPQ